jgi:hypothetical protein
MTLGSISTTTWWDRKKIPLVYVMCKHDDIPLHNIDPRAKYPIVHQNEMAARAPPHTNRNRENTPLYNTDNKQGGNLIHKLTRNHKCSIHQKPCSGHIRYRGVFRDVFLALWDHYLGIYNVNCLAAVVLNTYSSHQEGIRVNLSSSCLSLWCQSTKSRAVPNFGVQEGLQCLVDI